MPAIERQTAINASAEKVFDYLADFPRYKEWAAHHLRIEQTSPGPVAVGTTFASVGRMTALDYKGQGTVTEFLPNERLVFDVTGDTGHFRHYLFLKKDGPQTVLTKAVEPLRLKFTWRLRWPLARLVIPYILGGDLKRIKAKVEMEAKRDRCHP